MKKKVGIVSLGCAKNRIDSEMILAIFPSSGYEITPDPASADLIIVNTCGFIESAKKEAIETILEMREYHSAKLAVLGCFVERNLVELSRSLPEVDLFVPLGKYSELPKLLGKLLGADDLLPLQPLSRVLSTPDYFAYLRISEGCDNFCSFCAIPYIRGRYVSRPLEEIIREAESLKKKGIKELDLVSQDPMHYGVDFHNDVDMLTLLERLDEMGFYAIRLLYLYPDEITIEELEFIAKSKSILHYFDIPIQCASDHLLKLMNRHGTKEGMSALFRKIRCLMPDAVLRTTLISGFPQESAEDQRETLEFMNEVRFDHLGDLPYSKEEGTAASKFKGQLPLKTKMQRHDEVMELARKISYENNKARVGSILPGIVSSYDPEKKLYTLLSPWNAPDDIDGKLYFTSDKPLKVGELAEVKITSSFIYDLSGEAL